MPEMKCRGTSRVLSLSRLGPAIPLQLFEDGYTPRYEENDQAAFSAGAGFAKYSSRVLSP